MLGVHSVYSVPRKEQDISCISFGEVAVLSLQLTAAFRNVTFTQRKNGLNHFWETLHALEPCNIRTHSKLCNTRLLNSTDNCLNKIKLA